ncbi:MAG: DUF373 family protein [Candidatus Methanomethylophilaceae archaeon]|nr:DUF373 family protein [Candidatus Methanomethylophilaceae archaeon]
MKKTLVLVVDRDDDFGVKGKVTAPVIGIDACLKAANALGMADPEDSDLNALYAAINSCQEIRAEGESCEVALITGNEKVGYKSDAELVRQLEIVLDKLNPERVVLVGDGAEDEYIYPMVMSRVKVDSVRRVYVKQAPGLEGSFYIITRILDDPAKRKRFIAPLGFILCVISLFFIVPNIIFFLMNGNLELINRTTGSFIVFAIGLVLIMYAYEFKSVLSKTRKYIYNRIMGRNTDIIFAITAAFVVVISLIWLVYDVSDSYNPNLVSLSIYCLASLVWPVIMAFSILIVGRIISDYQIKHVFRPTMLMGCVSLFSIGLVLIGGLDLIQSFVSDNWPDVIGIVELVSGVILALVKNRAAEKIFPEDAGKVAAE